VSDAEAVVGLPLTQLASLTSGADMWHTAGIPGVVRAFLLCDGPHGVRYVPPRGDSFDFAGAVPATCFPPAVAMAATWDPGLVRRAAAALGREARAMGVDIILGPGMNLKRSPLGGRNFEYFSEDPLLTARLAAAYVEGLQGSGVGACAKHFAVNNQETDRMRVSALVDERTLREVYLRAFEHVVRTSAPAAVMAAYNRINGVPATEHRELLTEVLREEWGFDGVVMSDWSAVDDRVAALAAGCDLAMPYSATDALVEQAVADGDLAPERLDEVLTRLQDWQERWPPDAQGDLDAARAEAAAIAYETALQGAVLLTNDGVLPLDTDRSIAVVGELARTPRIQGGGSSHVVPTATRSPLDAWGERRGATRRGCAPGYRLDGAVDADLVTEALGLAASAEVTVVFLGLPATWEMEGRDRTTLDLPADQTALLAELASTGTRVVVVLTNGGVVTVSAWAHHAGAILEGWLLGQAGGDALAALLVGDVSPSGRLAETIPVRLQDHPSHPTFPGADGVSLYGEGVMVGYRGFDRADVPVAFPFGHGLTYGTVEYVGLELTPTSAGHDVAVTVRNPGGREVAEVVQVYVGPGDGLGGPPRAPRELRGFARIVLPPEATRTVTIPLRHAELAIWDAAAHRWRTDPGSYALAVGASSRDLPLFATIEVAGDGPDPVPDSSWTIAEWRRLPGGAEALSRLAAAAGIPEPWASSDPEAAAIHEAVPLRKFATPLNGIDEAMIARVSAEVAGSASRRPPRG
jgi:beta-glucosidase